MFKDRLNTIMTLLEANNGEIAGFAGFDRTNISHMRSGKRIPSPESKVVKKLAGGIFLFAKEKNISDRLYQAIGSDDELSESDAQQLLIEWLFQDNDPVAGAEQTAVRKESRRIFNRRLYHTFGERFNISMNLADLSNIQLSRLIHLDTSLISRYRNGIRHPGSNKELAEKISAVLFDRIERADRLTDLAKMIGTAPDETDQEDFLSWLFETNGINENAIGDVEILLDILDSYPGYNTEDGNIDRTKTDITAGSFGESADNSSVYFGTEGLRIAVLRLLSDAVRNGSRELLLYSDEDQFWLTGSRDYLIQWFTFMSTCVRTGTRIRIIHNIDRKPAEMKDAIRSWLPLYMSGMIESFYCGRPRNTRFSHTMFIDPGNASINAFHVAGSESSGIYHYLTDSASLHIQENEFSEMLRNARPLLKTGEFVIDEGSSDVTIVQSVLSIATMPQELVESFGSKVLMEHWRNTRETVIDHLSTRKVTECIPLADKKDLAAGIVPVERISGMEPLFYTPEQYAMHLANIRKLQKEYSGFRFVPNPEPPFMNISILSSDELTKVTHTSNPDISFCFTHPFMCRAFRDFTGSLLKNANGRHAKHAGE